jgi:hypothetical protein
MVTMKTQMQWIAVAALAIAVGATAQSSPGASENGSAAAQAGQASASAAQATSVSAELTKKIDSKDAKVGDEVAAKTTAEARLADGTKLPKGSKLVGHVTDVQPKSHDNHDSHVAFAFDHAVLKDGHEVPVQAMMRSIAVPAPMASAGSPDDMMAGGGMQGSGPRGAGPAGGAGLPNGVAATAHNATGPSGPTSIAAAGGLNNATSGIDGSANGAANNTALNGGAGVDSRLGSAGLAMPVGNLAGVTFAAIGGSAGASPGAAASTSMATMLTGHGKNVTLDSGAQMTLSVAPR